MRHIFASAVKRDPGSAVALAVALLALISIETIFLEAYWKRGEETRKSNDQLEASNSQMQRQVAELHAATQRVSATFTRLNDGIIRVPGNDGRLLNPLRNPKENLEFTDNKVAKSFRDYGLVVNSLKASRRESSISFEAASNHFEFHRLLPFLAEQENSNAFLFLDKLDLIRPVEVPAFSMSPTGLQTMFLIRVLSAPK
jgi:septal ring factor EnvC (AmiA/AmiB activator)